MRIERMEEEILNVIRKAEENPRISIEQIIGVLECIKMELLFGDENEKEDQKNG